jgi:2-oxo-3-hexenedioate decarboxylase
MSPDTLLAHLDDATPWPDAARPTHASLEAAYADALAVRARRIARGEQPRGFKIGFTNRTLWDRYGVHAPIWGTVWDTTLQPLDDAAPLDLRGLCEPRLEPEVVFGLSATPPRHAGLAQLFDCIDWVAPGFEVVQSHAPGWRFGAAESVADGGLHGRLRVGPRQRADTLAPDGPSLDARLAACRVRLLRNGEAVDQGCGAQVLDGPLHALQHFVRELNRCPGAPTLQPGDVVTTGTWTDAWPLLPGQRWRAEFDAPLGPIGLSTLAAAAPAGQR